MRKDGKLDYVEMLAAAGSLDSGFDGAASHDTKPLPVLCSENLARSLNGVIEAGGRMVRPPASVSERAC